MEKLITEITIKSNTPKCLKEFCNEVTGKKGMIFREDTSFEDFNNGIIEKIKNINEENPRVKEIKVKTFQYTGNTGGKIHLFQKPYESFIAIEYRNVLSEYQGR